MSLALEAHAPARSLTASWTRRGAFARALAEQRDEPFSLRARRLLTALAGLYPDGLRSEQLADVERNAFHLERAFAPGAAIADLGGGLGTFSLGCAALGMRAWVLDDFGDLLHRFYDLQKIGLHQELEVEVVTTPIRRWGEHFDDESLDIVTCFDGIEHWLHSPQSVFAEAHRVLRPGGTLLIGSANAARLGNRLGALFGRASGASFEQWYYPPEFRGPVREPVLGDLLRVVRELGFERQAVWGRNWRGYAQRGLRRRLHGAWERLLHPVPTLCGAVYVQAVKPI